MEKVYENPTFQMADVDLKFSKPEARIHINRDKANVMDVSTRDLAETLQYGLSGQRMGYFYMNGKQYEILGEINRQQRNKPADLRSIYLRSSDGRMIQMDNLIELEYSTAPSKLYRYNRFVSATISAGLADGKTIGEGLDEMDKIAADVLDDTFRTSLAGDSKDFRESASSLMFAFILALVLIYLILAAQFESFKDPMVIMLTVPLAITGALIFMYFGDITMNIFSQIGIIMLIGLVAKNGILIVEFANQKQHGGIDKMQAVREAALQRLRPILMTSAATVLGLVPLAFATGEGCNQRIAMGVAVVGGMLVSTFLTMYVVPAVYSYISTNQSAKNKKNEEQDSNCIDVVYVRAGCCPAERGLKTGHGNIAGLHSKGIGKQFSIRMVKNRQQVSDNNATPANAGLLPTVDLSASYGGDFHTSRSTSRATGIATTEKMLTTAPST